MSLQKVKAVISEYHGQYNNHFEMVNDVDWCPAYGTGGYNTIQADLDNGEVHTELCKFGHNVWVNVAMGEWLEVYVVYGDPDVIKPLVKAEIDHFDSDLEWEVESKYNLDFVAPAYRVDDIVENIAKDVTITKALHLLRMDIKKAAQKRAANKDAPQLIRELAANTVTNINDITFEVQDSGVVFINGEAPEMDYYKLEQI